jgi:uncharacterized metal-binding protein YceD (DUF177 family)
VNPGNEYKIEFVKLKIGSHNFNFEIGPTFFDLFEGSTLDQGNINVDLEFKRSESHFELQFKLEGKIGLSCDRCLDDISYPTSGEQLLMVKFDADRKNEVEENIIYLSPEDTSLNVAQPIFEIINLSLPMAKYCEDAGKECNEKMLEKIDGLRPDESEEIDPRWNKLKELYKK